jgi:16S rRNA (guanine966-N2)-methyltransferase
MRIVAGSHGGRRLKAPSGSRVRPTPDKVREALFSILGDRVERATFLDLFAGTGAVGFEALSRGALRVHAVEQSNLVRRVIKENAESLGLQAQMQISSGQIPRCLDGLAQRLSPFDFIFADPPYGQGYPDMLLNLSSLLQLIKPEGTLVIELPRGEEPQADGWRGLDIRHYGDTLLSFFAPVVHSDRGTG